MDEYNQNNELTSTVLSTVNIFYIKEQVNLS